METRSLRLWSRRWAEGESEYYQGFHLIALVPGAEPNVGVRISIRAQLGWYLRDSYATAEVFDGNQWHPVAGLPTPLMKCGRVGAGGKVRWDDTGLEKDIALLLHDTELAFHYQARIFRSVPEQEET